MEEGKNGLLPVSEYRGAIMGVAALWIYFFHCWILVFDGLSAPFSILYSVEFYLKLIGFTGVDIFLLLSGIGLTYAIKKGSVPKFYFRRIRRILLPFVVLGISMGIVREWGWEKILKNLSCYNFLFYHVDSFLWFGPAILILYLFFPLYFKLFDKAKSKEIFTLGAILVWLLLSLVLRDKMRSDLFGFTNRIPVFVFGIMLGHVIQTRKNIEFTLQTYLTLIVMLISGFYLAYLFNYTDVKTLIPVDNCLLPNILIAVSLTLLLARLFCVLDKKTKAGKWIVKIFGFFGMISLEFYCVQYWFADMVPLFVQDGWSKHLINIVLFLLVTATSWVCYVLFRTFWELVEKPFAKKNSAKAE